LSARHKQLPPAAADPVSTLLAARFSAPDESREPAPAPAVEAAQPTPRGKRARREPVGMTRQTFYVSMAAAEALNAAAARIQAATGGMVNKHEALSAIITAGVEQADSALSRLRAEKMRELGPGDITGV
jgi:hypothetical protein